MTDTLDGNRVREYPQALLKQFDNINPHPEYSGQDIIAMVKKRKIHVSKQECMWLTMLFTKFNSDADWYFDVRCTYAICFEHVAILICMIILSNSMKIPAQSKPSKQAFC